MCKDSSSLWVTQRACRVFGSVVRQQSIIQEGVIAPDSELVKVLQVDTTDLVKLSACEQGVLVLVGFSVNHILIRMHVPIIVVFEFHGRFVEHLCRTDMILAAKAAEEQL